MTDYTEARALAERACGLLSIGQDTTNSAMEQVSRALLSALGEMDRVRKERDASLYGRNADRDAALDARNTALRERDEAREAKDGAYRERDRLVAALSKLFPSHLARHPDSDETWDNDWRWIVFVDLPTGQASWHIHDSELPLFGHLPHGANAWDGHTTDEKYARLAALGGKEESGE